MLRKTTLAVLSAAVSGIAVAGSMGPVCTPGNVTVPCETRAWDLGIQALYLQPLYSSVGGYLPGPNNTIAQVKGDWSWGFRAEGSYHFNTGNDVTINWTHLGDDTAVYGLQGGTLSVNVQTNAVTQQLATFSATINDKFDQVNLVMGQHADFGAVKKMRFYAGLQYAKIVDYVNYYYNITPASALFIVGNTQFVNADFNGVGPVTGIDYSYDITNGFSLTANAAASILYGSSRYNTGYVYNPSGLVITSKYGMQKAIVPSLEGKLGLNYAYQMAQGVLNLQGGYQAIDYFSALQSQGAGLFGGAISTTNYGVYGPYFGIKYVGMA